VLISARKGLSPPTLAITIFRHIPLPWRQIPTKTTREGNPHSLTSIFFTTDVHGSDICWNKFINAGKFYNVQVIILGGDMTGKAIVPVVHNGNSTYRTVLLEQETISHGQDELQGMIKRIRSRGYYPYLTDPDELSEINGRPEKINAIFKNEVLQTLQRWLEIADTKLAGSGIRCYVAPGNDDMFEIDAIIAASKSVELAEGRVFEIDSHHEMISSGYTNPTPWGTFREEGEEALRVRYETMTRELKHPNRAIFNFHAPPFGSALDDAPEMTADMRPKYAGNSLIPVGSKAGRAVIEASQPLLGLHGHIHEARGTARIGKTLCINPGSMYEQGTLMGALIKLGKDKIENYLLTNG
jgi:Icc-related predicted phosphoesterase